MRIHYKSLSDDQIDAIWHLFEEFCSLPYHIIKRNLKNLRILGEMLGLDEEEFFKETGGFHLYEEKQVNEV